MALIRPYRKIFPEIDDSVFLAENSVIIGDVAIGMHSSIWYNVIVRGDVHYIKIGARTSIQDGCILHVQKDTHPLIIGNDVSVAHGAILHGCTINNRVLVGIGAKVLDGAEVESNSLIAAGTLVKENEKVPSGVLFAGVPGKIKRDLNEKECKMIKIVSERYVKYAQEYIDTMP